MKGLSLDNDKRKETMDSYLLHTANSNIIQSPVTFEPTEQALNGTASVIESLPFLSLNKQGFLMTLIDFNDWLRPVLPPYKPSQFVATIASIADNILRMEFTMCNSCLTKNTTSDSDVMERSTTNIGSYGKLILGICYKVNFITEVKLLLARCIKLDG